MIDAIALVIEGDILTRFHADALDRFALRIPRIPQVALAVVKIRRLNESHLSLKAGAVIHIGGIKSERVPAAAQGEITGWTGGVSWGRAAIHVAFRRAFHHLPLRRPLAGRPPSEIDATDAVPSLAKLLVGIDCADAEVLAKILGDAPHREQRALVVERVASRHCLPRLTVIDGQQPKVRVAYLAGHASAELRVRDAARINQIDWRNEVVRILQEEWPELRKVDRISLIDGELRLIGFDIAEVRIDGRIKDDAVFDDGLGLAARSAFNVPRTEIGVDRVRGLQRALILPQDVGIDLHIMRTDHALDALERSLLAERARDVGGNARPVVGLAVARNVAHEDHAPVRASWPETQAAKGDRHQRHPSLAGYLPFRVPNQVVVVIRAVVFKPRRVGLHARRIHGEKNAFAPVLEWIEQHRHVVVVQHIFATRQMRTNFAGVAVVADEDKIQRALCTSQPDFGFFRRRFSVARRVLNKIVDFQQLVFQFRLRRHAREAREPQSFGQQRHFQAAGRLRLERMRWKGRRTIALGSQNWRRNHQQTHSRFPSPKLHTSIVRDCLRVFSFCIPAGFGASI